MANGHYTCEVKNISRGAGRSAVAAAAYRHGVKIRNDAEGRVSDFSNRSGVALSAIVAPSGTADWVQDREQLWNTAEAAEKRKDARLAKEVMVGIPHQLSPDEREALVLDFARELAEQGCIVDVAIHEPPQDGDQRNHHAHLMLTTRELTEDGFGLKMRDLDKKEFVERTRELWASHANLALGNAGRPERVTNESLKNRGIDRPPQQKEGPLLTRLRRRGVEPISRFFRSLLDWNDNARERQLEGMERERNPHPVRNWWNNLTGREIEHPDQERQRDEPQHIERPDRRRD